jgi:hypothetical protein
MGINRQIDRERHT